MGNYNWLQDTSGVLITRYVFSYSDQVQRAIMRSRDTPSNHYWDFNLRDSSLDAPWGISRLFLSPNSQSSIGYMKQKPVLVRQMDHTQGPQIEKKRRAKHHGKRYRWCRSANMVRLITAFDFSPADFKRFLTALADRRLFGNHCLFRTGVFANGIRLTKRCSALSSHCDVSCVLPDLGTSFTVLVWVYFLASRLTTV